MPAVTEQSHTGPSPNSHTPFHCRTSWFLVYLFRVHVMKERRRATKVPFFFPFFNFRFWLYHPLTRTIRGLALGSASHRPLNLKPHPGVFQGPGLKQGPGLGRRKCSSKQLFRRGSYTNGPAHPPVKWPQSSCSGNELGEPGENPADTGENCHRVKPKQIKRVMPRCRWFPRRHAHYGFGMEFSGKRRIFVFWWWWVLFLTKKWENTDVHLYQMCIGFLGCRFRTITQFWIAEHNGWGTN